MRIVFGLISGLLVAAICFVLNGKDYLPVPMGPFLSPQQGFWQNAEPAEPDFSADIPTAFLKGKVDVYLDERLVPHVFAEQETDAYFVQGYLHAKFRLWQMELQSMAAAGRASELVGEKALPHDREFRRLGMVYAAENCLAEMENDAEVKQVCNAYTAGVNFYIRSLTKSTLPIEYKLLDLQPEYWTNLKSALFLKYMSYDLSARENDFEMTAAKSFFNKSDFDLLFPRFQDSTSAIIPRDSIYTTASMAPVPPSDVDSVYFNFKNDSSDLPIESHKPDPENGSNNWAVGGSKTLSGAPILCNDPHLGLNLPSLWFEMQISVPDYNAYGVSFPGAPGIIIGFNDSCAFGFTNGGRDVRDYYSVQFKDENKDAYWYDSTWLPVTKRIEHYKVAGGKDVDDTVAYTVFGPVMYDESFSGNGRAAGNYAVRWSAHDPSNEFRFFYLLNRAHNYDDFSKATAYLSNPGQNCVFACKNGDIALRTAGRFPAKWEGQGDFVMPGKDSRYAWQFQIPFEEMPYQYNPARGFVSSANQRQLDSTYPYYLGRDYPPFRGRYLNRKLEEMQRVTVKDMMALQTSSFNSLAAMAIPLWHKYLLEDKLSFDGKSFWQEMERWNYSNEATSAAATVFDLAWKSFYDTIYMDEYKNAPTAIQMPFKSTLIESLLRDSAYKFVDNIQTSDTETIYNMVAASINKAAIVARKLKDEGRLEWSTYKDTHVDYLLKLSPFGREHLITGGNGQALNAISANHGPSWRMVVSLTSQTEAYGIYPGGQSGNPGSFFYDDGVDTWAASFYYPLWLMNKNESSDKRIKWAMRFYYYD